jgi:hypothetical protein
MSTGMNTSQGILLGAAAVVAVVGIDYTPSMLDAAAYGSILSLQGQRGGHGIGNGAGQSGYTRDSSAGARTKVSEGMQRFSWAAVLVLLDSYAVLADSEGYLHGHVRVGPERCGKIGNMTRGSNSGVISL